MKYRKKPVEVEAIQFTQNNFPQIEEFTNGLAHTFGIENSRVGIATCIIPTLEGDHIAAEGDYIIKGIKGEFYPCKPDIFEKTYESVGKNKPSKGCEYCKGRAYTKKPLTVITRYGRRIELTFEFCPKCGRKLNTEEKVGEG